MDRKTIAEHGETIAAIETAVTSALTGSGADVDEVEVTNFTLTEGDSPGDYSASIAVRTASGITFGLFATRKGGVVDVQRGEMIA